MESSSRLTTAVSVLAVICLFGLPAYGALYSGGGTEGDPYIIDTAAKMNDIGANPGDWGSYFLLMADIDLSGYTGDSFNIIGYSDWDPPINQPFSGVFDGNGHTISNFTYTCTGEKEIGIFGYLDGMNAEIRDLGLIDPNVEAGTSDWVGSLVGEIWQGVVTNCYVKGGKIHGGIEVGGLVGTLGDPLGSPNSVMSNCYANTSVSGSEMVGVMVGTDSDNDTISRCYARGSVSGITDVGGLIGYNNGIVTNSYSASSVSGTTHVGGLAGRNRFGDISHSYANGSVAGVNDVGGLVGYDYNTGTYAKCFWDSDVSSDVNGIGNTADPNVIAKSTDEMQTLSTFVAAGWDFGTPIWVYYTNCYPRLAWEPTLPIGDLNHDGIVDLRDFAIFADHWLAGVE